MRLTATLVCLFTLLLTPALSAQDRPASPRVQAATVVSGEWDASGQRPQYKGGKWIEVDYSAPILRQRDDIFGDAESYGQRVLGGSPVWRAGANKSTRLKTEANLKIGGKTVEAGEYSLFVDLKGPQDWELIVSNYGAVDNFRNRDDDNLWGAYGYTDAKDVARTKMEVTTMDGVVDQLGYGFVDVSKNRGTLCVWWATTMGCAPFEVAD